MDADKLRKHAQAAVLDGLPAGRTLAAIELDVAGCRVRGKYEPDLAMLELIIAALDDAGVSRDRPLDISDWRRSFLPEINFHNRHTDVQRLVYALQTAAAFRTGLRDGTYEAASEDAIRPTAEEKLANPRARSAKLRWARKPKE